LRQSNVRRQIPDGSKLVADGPRNTHRARGDHHRGDGALPRAQSHWEPQRTGSAIFDVVRNFDDVAGSGIIRCGKDAGVRHDRNGRSDWSSSFRLIIDDVPRAPTNLLDEVVASESAKDGDVVFELPVSVKDVMLQIGSGDDSSRLPFKLP